MSERTIDSARQGGGDNGPKRAEAAPEMTYAEAVEYAAKFAWRALPTKSDRARTACIREVERLHVERAAAAVRILADSRLIDELNAEMAADRELAQRQVKAWVDAYRDLSGRRAAEVERLQQLVAAYLIPPKCTQDCQIPDCPYTHQWTTADRNALNVAQADIARLVELIIERGSELASFRAALLEIVGCAHGEAATCARDPYGWSPCCLIRGRMVAAGLLPAAGTVNEEEGA